MLSDNPAKADLQSRIEKRLEGLGFRLSDGKYADCVTCAYQYKNLACFCSIDRMTCDDLLASRQIVSIPEGYDDFNRVKDLIKDLSDEMAIIRKIEASHG